ncbi:MAG: putative quinol monooxygenase [Promethearchaeota archaeon]|jgi:quinol monooxygenase YgiN
MEKKSNIRINAIIKVPEGKLEEFKQTATDCLNLVREKDTKTLKYDWFLNGDQTECEIHEEYESSEAIIEHMINLGGTLQKLINDFPPERFAVFGDPSQQLIEMGKGVNAKIYSLFQGLE